MVRTAVWAGLYALPTKEAFMKSINESYESAKEGASEFTSGAEGVVSEVDKLFDVAMPASDVSFIPSAPAPAPA